MADEPKPTKPAKKKRRRKPREEIVDYIMKIDGWDWSCWLALNTMRDPLDPYHEHRHLEVTGRLLRPLGLKTDRVEMLLFPSISMQEEQRKDFKPIAVGSLEAYPDRIAASMGMPSDALAPVLQMLIADRLKFVVMRGAKFRYRSARLISYSLKTSLSEDDLSEEAGD